MAWVGDLGGIASPITHTTVEPARPRAGVERQVAQAIADGRGYPDTGWFDRLGLTGDEVPTREVWDAHAEYGSTQCYAQGVARALGWAFGDVDPDELVPLHRDDGTQLPEKDRADCALVLRELTVRPRKPPRLRLSRRPEPAGPSWLA